jgi:lysophospholipase L1-like esterase
MLAMVLILSAALAACTNPKVIGPTQSTAPPVVYAAIGASETYGMGADDRYRQAWPQVFYHDALPASAVLYNFGIPGATTAQAVKDELPAAVRVHANLVTVWLNVNDLVQGVSPASYGGQLRQILHALRGPGVRLLVANVPDLRQLPAFKACQPNAPGTGPACPVPATLVPSPDKVIDLITAYNTTIAQVAKQEGAVVVDLFSGQATIAQHPDWISSDGFHPSATGYLVIAQAFRDAYRRAG